MAAQHWRHSLGGRPASLHCLQAGMGQQQHAFLPCLTLPGRNLPRRRRRQDRQASSPFPGAGGASMPGHLAGMPRPPPEPSQASCPDRQGFLFVEQAGPRQAGLQADRQTQGQQHFPRTPSRRRSQRAGGWTAGRVACWRAFPHPTPLPTPALPTTCGWWFVYHPSVGAESLLCLKQTKLTWIIQDCLS